MGIQKGVTAIDRAIQDLNSYSREAAAKKLAEHSQRLKDGAERAEQAQMILNLPIIKEFFERSEKDILVAMRRLPDGAVLEEYQFLKAMDYAVRSLKSVLIGAVERGQNMQTVAEGGKNV